MYPSFFFFCFVIDAQKTVVIEIKVLDESSQGCNPTDQSTCEDFKAYFKNQVGDIDFIKLSVYIFGGKTQKTFAKFFILYFNLIFYPPVAFMVLDSFYL